MPNQIVGHQQVLDRFAESVAQDRLGSAYLFVGPEGIGKRLVALRIAKSLLCEGTDPRSLDACEYCSACQQVDAFTHPDLLTISRLPDKNVITVGQLIGEDERRMKEGLCHDIALKSFRGGRKIAVIDDADFFNAESSNCLLKTLEEPPPLATIFLISTSVHRQLPTIRSRTQIVRFNPLSVDQIETLIVQSNLVAEAGANPRELALACNGSMKTAMLLADPEVLRFRNLLISQLASLDPGANDFSDAAGSFVDEAGKDNKAEQDESGTPAALKRNRMRLISEFAIQFYRTLLVALHGQSSEVDPPTQTQVQATTTAWQGDPELIADCIDRCVEFQRQVAANANQATLLECWLSDLGRISRGEAISV